MAQNSAEHVGIEEIGTTVNRGISENDKQRNNKNQQARSMKMRVILTPDDLKKGDLAEPGWHTLEVMDYSEQPAETDGSTNCIFHFKIIDGPNKGVSPRKLFNEKALGFGKSLWKAFNFPYDPEKGYDLSSDLFKQTIGHRVQGYIKRGKSNKGSEFNDLVDFRPMQ